MIKKIMLITSFVFSLQAMQDEVCTFISYYADYCYKGGGDFNDYYRGGGVGERCPLYGTAGDTEFIDSDKLLELYEKKYADEISYFCVGHNEELAKILENKKPSDVVKKFDSVQKSELLRQLQGYGPSKYRWWVGSLLPWLGFTTIILTRKMSTLYIRYIEKNSEGRYAMYWNSSRDGGYTKYGCIY